MIVRDNRESFGLCQASAHWKTRAILAVGFGVIALAGVGTNRVLAQVTYSAGVDAQYEHSSNVFDLPTGYVPPGVSSSDRGDSFYAYGVKGDVKYLWSQQNFFLNATGTEFRYDRFTQLDHSEYTSNGGWNFKFGGDVDGSFVVSRSRTMVPFSQVYQYTVALQTEQRETLDIGYLFLPDWRIEGTGYTRDLDEPLDGAPNLKLREYDGKGTLQFLGVSHLTAGASFEYLTGAYTGAGTNGEFDIISGPDGNTFFIDPDYKQLTEALEAKYIPSDISNFDGTVGYSDRTSTDALNSVSGVTGSLAYHRALTGKTSFTVTISRQINAYVGNVGSEIDSIADGRILWQATYKTGVALGYTYTYRDLPGQGVTPADDRIDHLQFATLNIDWEPTQNLVVKPYANVQTRHSNVAYGGYNATVYGITVTLQTPPD